MTTTRASSRSIAFPVLTHLKIENYALYPGDGQGLNIEFKPGIAVIVGINGIGKTTLLQACMRLILGPFDWMKRDPGSALGSSPIDIRPWRDKNYFRQRASDGGTGAVISGVIVVRQHSIVIKRSLEDLRVLELSIDGIPFTSDNHDTVEKEYQEALRRFGGFASFVDAYLLIRYLQFFMEDRMELLWDAGAQREVLRALFFEESAADEARHLFAELQAVDSRYRNQRAVANQLLSRITDDRDLAPKEKETRLRLRTAQRALKGAETRTDRATTAHDAIRGHIAETRLRLEQAKLTLLESQEAYAAAEEHAFDRLTARADLGDSPIARTLTRALTGGGCLVCGSRSSAVRTRMRERKHAHRCALCAAPPSEQEAPAQAVSQTKKRLNDLDTRVTKAQRDVEGLTASLTQARQHYQVSQQEIVDAYSEGDRLQRQVETISRELPMSSKAAAETDRTIAVMERQLQKDRATRERLSLRYEDVLGDGEARVRSASSAIAERFQENVTSFLAEKCDLVYETAAQAAGQGTRRFDMPRFSPRLSGASSPTLVVSRKEADQVSESQKEFLDLAFRMAVTIVASAGGPTMLFLETPESSLDAVFAIRAGELFGQFAMKHDNRLVATSNLTNGDMVSALFGAATLPGTERTARTPRPSHFLPVAERWPRVINLLTNAAPNAAILKYGRQYRAALQKAVVPEGAVKAPKKVK